MSIQSQIEELRQKLHLHNYSYYVLDAPTISDSEFDLLLQNLIHLEKQHPEFYDKNSPSQKVGGEIIDRFETKAHATPMLSLSNVYSEQELNEFCTRVQKRSDREQTYTCELKYDGVAINIRYTEGKFVNALTRGNGVQGDDVSHTVKTVKNLPLVLQGNDIPNEMEIRGEIIIDKQHFEQINNKRRAQGQTPYANRRNLASGTLKLQNSNQAAERHLSFKIYSVHILNNHPFRTHSQLLSKAHEWGFPKSDFLQICTTTSALYECIAEVETKKDSYPYDIDGMVIKLNDIDQYTLLGNTAKSPRWATAYKFVANQAKTTLLSISYQVGRTGAITPVANLEPVWLDGTVIKRASLHNADQMTRLGIHSSDTVIIEKGGEIIPKIVGIDLSKRRDNSIALRFIPHCPECKTPLERLDGEAAHYCPNTLECPPQIKARIEHFVSKKGMNIEGLGGGKLDMFLNKQIITSPADIFSLLDLPDNKLVGLSKVITTEEGSEPRVISLQQKSIDNLKENLHKSKHTTPFEKVLYAIGIRFVGETVAKKVARHFKSIDQLSVASFESIMAIPDVGEQIANSIKNFFANPEHLALIDTLRHQGLQLEITQNKQQTKDFFVDKRFVVTGTFTHLSREELKNKIESVGGINVSSLSKKTDYLVAGDKAGSTKLDKANALGIDILNEEQILTQLN